MPLTSLERTVCLHSTDGGDAGAQGAEGVQASLMLFLGWKISL